MEDDYTLGRREILVGSLMRGGMSRRGRGASDTGEQLSCMV